MIDDLPPSSTAYSPISVKFRGPMPHESLRSKQQTPLSLFQLFISSTLLQIIAKHTNVKTDLERIQVSKHQRSWTSTGPAEIGAFIAILLYMGYARMPSVQYYWAVDSKNPVHLMIINCMGRVRWQQIKWFLKISDHTEQLNSQGPDWWKKLEPLASDFRKAAKKFWISRSHLSIDEQLILFRGRCRHTIQIASKTAGIGFKLYSLCQENYLIDFLFTSKVWSKISRIWACLTDVLLRLARSASWKLLNSWIFQPLNGN